MNEMYNTLEDESIQRMRDTEYNERYADIFVNTYVSQEKQEYVSQMSTEIQTGEQ